MVSLGLVFALTDYETDTVFTSIMMHMIHNSILIFYLYYNIPSTFSYNMVYQYLKQYTSPYCF